MTAVPQDVTTALPAQFADSEFGELDQLEVIETSELKLSGSYHSYVYYAAEGGIHDIAKA